MNVTYHHPFLAELDAPKKKSELVAKLYVGNEKVLPTKRFIAPTYTNDTHVHPQ